MILHPELIRAITTAATASTPEQVLTGSGTRLPFDADQSYGSFRRPTCQSGSDVDLVCFTHAGGRSAYAVCKAWLRIPQQKRRVSGCRHEHRAEERLVGRECVSQCRSRRSRCHYKKN